MLNAQTVLIYDREYLIALDLDRIVRRQGAAATVLAHNWDEAAAALRGWPAIRFAIIDFDGGVADDGAMLFGEAGVAVAVTTGDRRQADGVAAFTGAPVIVKPYTEADIVSAMARLTNWRPL